MAVIGVDIGGSGVRAAWVDASGRRGGRRSAPASVLAAGEQLVAALRGLLGELERSGGTANGGGGGPAATGVAVPGFPTAAGDVRFAVNAPALDGLRLGPALERPVALVPDLAAAALAEARLGAGRGCERVLCVALGTGANAALIAGGRIVETAYGCLGDAGHVIVEPDGPPCPCGGRGCLEAVASGFALARDGAALGLADAAAVAAAASAGDAGAAALLERAGRALGRAIAGWAAMTFPERVVVGGGVAQAGELLLAPARAELERAGASYVVGGLELVQAALGTDAALVGAGLAALAAPAEAAA